LQAIGVKIRRKRQETGLSQPELARKLGVRVETIQNWESGRTIPPVGYLPGLTGFLGFSPLETACE
jgi:transcriptional regulator with XRE-family HTH domain